MIGSSRGISIRGISSRGISRGISRRDIGGVAAGATTRRRLRARRRLPRLPAAPARFARAGSARDRRQRPHALRQDARAAGAGSRKLSGSRPRDACGGSGLGLRGPQGRGAAVERGLREEVGLGLARARRKARRLCRGRGGPRRLVPRALALYVRRASPASTRRTPRAWRTSWRTTPRTKPRARAAHAPQRRAGARREAAGPDDTAREKRSLDAGNIAACARLLLDKLYDRHLGRRGDAVLAVGPLTPPTPTPSTPSS